MNSTVAENVPCADNRGSPPVAPTILLESELEFYGRHKWSLNPCPTVSEVVRKLSEQLSSLQTANVEWQRTEIANNIFLLSCAISNAVDDYLRGTALNFQP